MSLAKLRDLNPKKRRAGAKSGISYSPGRPSTWLRDKVGLEAGLRAKFDDR
jgi:hypothetical protein